jgi:putative membrane protein
MNHLADGLVVLILVLHLYIVMLETVFFEQRGFKVFGFNRKDIPLLKPALANQGCYNCFLVAALALGLMYPNPEIASAFRLYGLGCVAIAGVFGALTVKRSIFFVQTLPALLALGAFLTR